MPEFLPNNDHAEVPESKILDYLLSTTHSSGKAKSVFFFKFGFSIQDYEELKKALLEHARKNPIRHAVENERGIRYTIEGPLTTPDGRHPNLRSIWFIEAGEQHPRLVTAYPLPPGKK